MQNVVLCDMICSPLLETSLLQLDIFVKDT